MGSFDSASYGTLALGALPIVLGSGILLALRWRLNLLPLSDEEARTSGVRIGALRAVCILCATAITAACVSMSGQVGWVGLLAPHVCRMKFGNNHLSLLPACISLGAVFMMLVDTAARSLSAGVIPLSVLTAIFGASFFIVLMRGPGVAAMKLEVRGGCFAYPKCDRQILKETSFCAASGQTVAILGPNGAGKTTLLRCIMGLLRWQSGMTYLDDAALAGAAAGEAVAYDLLRAPDAGGVGGLYRRRDCPAGAQRPHWAVWPCRGRRMCRQPRRQWTDWPAAAQAAKMQRPFRAADAAGAAGPGAGQ